MCLDELPFAPGRSFAGSIPGAASMVGRLPAQLDYERRQLLDCGQLHPGQLRSFSISSPARPAPGMPKRPPASSRSTITAPGQLAGLLVAPRPMYGHAMSSQPANRCSTGQLHSTSFTRPQCGPRATQPAQNRPRSSSFVASPAPGPRPGAQLPGRCATQPARLACSRCHRAGTPAASTSSRWPRLLDCRQLPGRPRQLAAPWCHTPGTLDSFPGHSFTLDQLVGVLDPGPGAQLHTLDSFASVLDQLPGSSGQQLPGPANRAASPGLDYGPG